MGKPATKAELIEAASQQFDKLFKMIDGISETAQSAAFCFDADKMGDEAHWKRDKNLRDVLVHLYEWHRLLIEWEESNSNGESKPFLPPPFTWKTYGAMNTGFWKKHQNTTLDKAREMLIESHKQVLLVIGKYTDEQLFTKALYKWTGTSSLGQYCISATSSHYDWAVKKLKAQIKAMKD